MRDALRRLGDATWSELTDALRPRRGHASRALQRLVEAMVAGGEVRLLRHGAYRLAAPGERVSGVVERSASGLRLRTEAGAALVLRTRLRVRPGDRLSGVAEGDAVAAVTAVEPSKEPVVGVLRMRPRAAYAESLDPHLRGRIDLVQMPPGRDGDVVEVEVLALAEGAAEGRVARIVESAGEAARAAEATLLAHRIPQRFSFDEGALDAPAAVSGAEAAGRRDLRDLPLVTIDGADARDFDDAVFAEPRPRGGWRLVVAIADVAHYVAPGSALDRDARERGNSVYLPDRVVPMLPQALSNGICSLVPNADRLALVCELGISANGRISSYAFFEAVIHSHARLTYDAVGGFLNAGDAGELDAPPAAAASIRALHAAYRALRRRREERGALDFDTREANVILRDGHPAGVAPVQRNDAHRLIEEAMIAANVAAARLLEARGGTPPLYRVHEAPAGEKLDALAGALRLVGERLPARAPSPKMLGALCAQAAAKSSWPRWVWETLVLRSLPQARYQPKRLGHYGLALPAYLHFTSPIRRYADLLVHRAIKGGDAAADELDAIAARISAAERRAEEAERAVDAWLKCALAEERIGETFGGTIAGVTGFGLFVELDGMFVQGLLHISNLGRDYYRYAPETQSLIADRSGMRFALADRVQVVVEDVFAPAGRIDLRLAAEPRPRGRGGRRSRRAR